MTHDEMIEAVAKAIYEQDSWRTWKGKPAFQAMARAAIRVIAPAVERALRERDQAVEALRLFVRLMNDPDYDLGELCEEFCTRAETILASIEGTGHDD